MTDRAVEQYRDEQIAKLAKRLDILEAMLPGELKKLSDTVIQVSGALDRIGEGQSKLRDDLSKALEVTQKTISEATVQYIDDRLGGKSVQLSQPGSTGPRGAFDNVFDKIQPAISRVIERWADNAQLPFMGGPPPQQAQGIMPEIVNLEKEVHRVATLKYKQSLEKMLATAYKDVGLPTPEAVKVGVSH